MAPERHDLSNAEELAIGKEGITEGGGILPESREAEIDPAKLAMEKIEAAATQVEKLAEDGPRQMDKVEQTLGLLPEEVVAGRQDSKISEQLEAINEDAKGLTQEFASNVSNLARAESDPEPQDTEIGSDIEIVRKEKENSEPTIKEAREKYIQILEQRGLFKLSKEDFQKYLSPEVSGPKDILMQQNVGNCFAVSGFDGLSKSPHFEILCRTSMARLPDGSWQVRIPFMSESGNVVTITPEELLPQKNKRYLRRAKGSLIMPDFRQYLNPVSGKEGMRVLEAAWEKARFGSMNRSEADKGGQAYDVLMLLGGKNFINDSIDARYRPYPNKDTLYEKPLAKVAYHKAEKLDDFLKNFDPEIYIAIGSSLGKISQNLKNGEYIVKNHCYTFSSVDAEKKLISLVNPWDTSLVTQISFAEFKENFRTLNLIRINNAALLKNMARAANSKNPNTDIKNN